MRRFALCFFLALPLACSAASAPETPSWDTDVYPILRGSCLHCHGHTAVSTTNSAAWRFDLCNPADFQDSGTRTDALFGALSQSELIVASIEPGHGGTRPRMPPPPATPLSDYDVAVLKNWAKLAKSAKAANPPQPELACRKEGSNNEPGARLIAVTRDAQDANVLLATIEVFDPDGDEVVGKATAGRASAHIMSTGRQQLRFAGASDTDPIIIKLSDGHATTAALSMRN